MRALGVVAAIVATALLAGPAHAATVRSDFNADGFDDLAVGTTNETLPGGLSGAGVVNVVYGGPGGLTTGPAPRQLSASDLGGASVRVAEFGAALDTGDFNSDGIADLAIGAPGEALGPGTTSPRAGAVYIAFGGPAGLGSAGGQRLTQSDAGGHSEQFEDFAGGLAAGDFDGDGHDDLALSATQQDLGRSAHPISTAGVVNVLYGTGAGGLSSARGQQFNQSQAAGRVEAFDLFGSSLAAGDLDGDGVDDLAIGAIGEDLGTPAAPLADAGVVNVLYGASGTGLGSAGAQQLTQTQAGGHSEQDDSFGYALAVGDLDGDGRDDLAASAIGEALGTGNEIDETGVVNLLFQAGGAPLGSGGARQVNQTAAGGRVEPDDGFAYSLTAADFDGDAIDDLAIGAPGETLGTTAAPIIFCGVVNVLYGDGATRQFNQKDAGSTPKPEDRFPTAVAGGDYDADGDADLALGTHSKDPGGVVNILPSAGPAGLVPTTGPSINQLQAGGSVRSGENFGIALSSSP